VGGVGAAAQLPVVAQGMLGLAAMQIAPWLACQFSDWLPGRRQASQME
jgi:hypothetical protein